MSTRTSPVLRKRRLGRRLRQMRERARMSLEEASARLDTTRSSLSRIEKGESRADVHLVRSMMDLYDHYDADLLDLARAAKRKGWWHAYGIKDRGYIGMETEAVEVLTSQLVYVPGLLQTEDYMRAVFASGSVRRTPDELENQVHARLYRQERLRDEESPLGLTAIVDESALRRPLGGPTAMRAQLRHLVEAAQLPSVTLQVLPYTPKAHSGLEGAFTILRFADLEDPDLLYAEYPTGAIHVEKPDELRAVMLVLNQLRSEALTPEDSVAFIETVATQM
ncbi:Helix-turn-helix domain-containing protein [Amycolatopsis marina]|uniref:Helix-turn-helix domain-containing protein n=1 Tax=Amycolatopsis marina TaxID=490629 RepID=A0A1I1BK04_9PSEU|nr:helix-turn-helix transcriptional regulator [Amycolatopsis marina]SFB48783.1 Helix-turn-helix domain-containing protein [Amycolatopsis marina]